MSTGVLITGCLCLAPLSVLTSGILIWSHLKIRKLRKYPGELVLMQCLMQFIIDWTWFLSYYALEDSNDFFWSTVKTVFTWAYFCSWNYASILSFEIYSKIKKPFKSTSKLRRAIYHTLSLGIPMLYVVLFLILGNEYRIPHIVWLCMSFPAFISLGLAGYSLYKLKGQGGTNYMIYHSLVVVAFSASLFLDVILNFFLVIGDSVPILLYNIWVLAGCSSGTIIFVARVSEPKMLRQVARCIVCRRDAQSEALTEDSEILESIIDQDFNPYFSFFESLLTSNVLKVLAGLSFLFSKRKPLEEYLIKHPNVAFWRFGVFLDSKVKYKVKEYFPEPFNILRTTEGISDFDLAASLNIKDNLKDLDQRTTNPGGRSSSFFYFTADKKYIIKTINQQELKILRTLIESMPGTL